MNELKKLKYGGYEEILEEKMEEIDKQAKVIQWYEKENRHNQEIIIKDIKELEKLHSIIKEVREYIEERYNGEVLTHTFDKDNVGELLEILKGSE